ncbi:MAG: hypothetical protein AAB263_19395 [Planctomycetota bacterium]
MISILNSRHIRTLSLIAVTLTIAFTPLRAAIVPNSISLEVVEVISYRAIISPDSMWEEYQTYVKGRTPSELLRSVRWCNLDRWNFTPGQRNGFTFYDSPALRAGASDVVASTYYSAGPYAELHQQAIGQEWYYGEPGSYLSNKSHTEGWVSSKYRWMNTANVIQRPVVSFYRAPTAANYRFLYQSLFDAPSFSMPPVRTATIPINPGGNGVNTFSPSDNVMLTFLGAN